MNREIKLRAWDEKNKIMYYDFSYIKSGNNGNDWIIFRSDKQREYDVYIKNPYFSQQIKIMQYTGLKDKNDKEIYEGDIIRISKLVNDVIVFENGQFKPKKATDYESYNFMINSEIIGNIYENSLLLEIK